VTLEEDTAESSNPNYTRTSAGLLANEMVGRIGSSTDFLVLENR
jgi:hypothetical protein